MGGDWQHLIQSVVVGLVFSFLLAKLISFVTAFKDEGLSITRGSVTCGLSHDGAGERHGPAPASTRTSQVGSDLGIGKSNSADSLAELSEVGSRLSDDNSVMAEKGSTAEPDDIVDDDSDDDWEGVESTELDEAFSAATAFVAATAADKSHKVPNEVQLQLYGFYKIATEGPCSAPPPPAFKMTARAKWQAWQKLGAMVPEDAMIKYIEIVTELFPTWIGGTEKRGQGRDEEDATATAAPGMMGPVFSSFVHEEEAGNDSKMDAIHDFAREGDVSNLTKCIDSGISVDLRDSEGRSPLHWAVDRGHLNVIELLASKKADSNAKDKEGQTPLHYAVVCDRESIAKFLVDQNADSEIKDNDGLSPADICEKHWPWLQKQVATGS